MDAADKREYLYDLAVGIGYHGPYTDDTLKELLDEGRYSVERGPALSFQRPRQRNWRARPKRLGGGGPRR